MSLKFNPRWLVLFAFMFVFILAVTVGADIGLIPTRFFGIYYSDKLGHLVLYGALGGLLHLALRRRALRLGPIALPVAFLVAASLGLADEAQQMFMPHRAFDLTDFAADLTGIGLFILSLEIGYVRLLTRFQTGLQ